MSAINHYRIMGFDDSLAKYKHELKLIIIPLAVNLWNRISFPKYHCIVQIKANISEIQGLFETCPCFASFNSCVIYNPNNNSAWFSDTIKFLSYLFKRENKTFIVP